jgi:hypothetical protein
MACGRSPEQVRAWRAEIAKYNDIMREGVGE